MNQEASIPKTQFDHLTSLQFRFALRILPTLFRASDTIPKRTKLLTLRSLIWLSAHASSPAKYEGSYLARMMLELPSENEITQASSRPNWRPDEDIGLNVLEGDHELPILTRIELSPVLAALSASQVFLSGGDHFNKMFFDEDFYRLSELNARERTRQVNIDLPLWHEEAREPALEKQAQEFLDLSNAYHWSFWREWYQGFLDGKPMDWELQRRVAMIPDEDWEKGPEHIARVIEEIRRDFEAERESDTVPKPEDKPVPAAQAEAMAQRLSNNRDAIALTAASVLEQIAEFRELVRGNNQLEPEFREKLLDFLDDLSAQLNALFELLPEDKKAPNEEAGEKGVRWLREFKASFFKEGAAYASPENVAKATIPTGIILGCTGIGSLLGFPGAGGIVGALITSQIKPGKAAEELMKPRTPEAD